MPGGAAAGTAPNEAVLQAIEAAQGKEGKEGVTVAQVTAATGLPTDEVEMEMAALLRGTLWLVDVAVAVLWLALIDRLNDRHNPSNKQHWTIQPSSANTPHITYTPTHTQHATASSPSPRRPARRMTRAQPPRSNTGPRCSTPQMFNIFSPR